MSKSRIAIAALSISAAAFVGLLTHEGYQEAAYRPVAGDVWTAGFGTTQGITAQTKLPPIQALARAFKDTSTFEGALKRCVLVPLHQHEYDAYISLSYNIGSNAFCNSTLVKLLNQEKYIEACAQILRWNKFQGKELAGLTNRRKSEFDLCTKTKEVV